MRLTSSQSLFIGHFSLLFLSLCISAQSFDEAYLKTLPDEMQTQVRQKLQESNSQSEPIYKRPPSKIDKSVESSRFGISLFNTMQTSFMPINEPNLDSEYVLDFGDVLEVRLIGQKSFSQKIDINRDGSISIDGLEKIYLSGLTLASAGDLIESKVSTAYLGTKSFISLVNVRDIQVYIVGDAYNPGLYTLNGNSNILHALSMAGGILDSGSMRSVQLKRKGEIVQTLDLYDLLINGDLNIASRLRSGDVIFVSTASKIVSIYGGVNKPMDFELLSNESTLDLIKYANGFNSTVDRSKPLRVLSLVGGITKTNLYPLSEAEKIKLDNKDAVYIPYHSFKKVILAGAIQYPGTYYLSEESKLSDLILKGGGYLPNADIRGGVLQSDQARQNSQLGGDMTYSKVISNMIEAGIEISSDMLLATQELMLAPSGRVIANFNLDILCDHPELDTLLQDNDSVFIPTKTQQVYIYGAVNSPGSLLFNGDYTLKDYISNSGGLTQNADKKNIFIVYPNGESRVIIFNSIRFLGSKNNYPIYPGSFIFVTPKLKMNTQQTASLWAPLVSSFALTLASIAALDNN